MKGLDLELGASLKSKYRENENKPIFEKGKILDSLDLNTGFDALAKAAVESIPDDFKEEDHWDMSPVKIDKSKKAGLDDSLDDIKVDVPNQKST